MARIRRAADPNAGIRAYPEEGRTKKINKKRLMLILWLVFLAAVFLFLLIKAVVGTGLGLSSVKTQAAVNQEQDDVVSASEDGSDAFSLPNEEYLGARAGTDASVLTEPTDAAVSTAEPTEGEETEQYDGPRFSDTVLRPVGGLFAGIRNSELFQISKTVPTETQTETEAVKEQN